MIPAQGTRSAGVELICEATRARVVEVGEDGRHPSTSQQGERSSQQLSATYGASLLFPLVIPCGR